MKQALSTQFSAQCTYLNSATTGLPCDGTITAMQEDMARWRSGTLNPKEYDALIDQCRELFGLLVECQPHNIFIANQASTSVGLLASSLPKGSKVLVADGDFTSVLFPFMAQQTNGIKVVSVPLEQVTDAVDPSFDWIAVSIAQSSNGQVADMAGIAAAARSSDCRVLLDGTQAIGWMPVAADYWDMLVCGAYKWLLSPRGTAFAAIKPDLRESILPIYANWYAGESRWDSIYGGPIRLAADARQYDISPAWLNWVGTLPALELIVSIGVENIYQHNVGLANEFCRRLDLPPANSAIVSVTGQGDMESLKRAGIEASVRGGDLRLSFHLYNRLDDVDAVVNAL